MNGLVISDVWKSFGTQSVLRGVDLEVPAGSLTAMLGPSGSGKTTLLRIVAGFDRADRGSVSLGGTLLDGPRHRTAPEHRKIGYVPQEGALFPHLTVGRNVAFGVPRAERRSGAIGDLLELVGMRGMGHRYPHELSGGQQQRVALARALAVRPELVLLDEPYSSLDPSLRAEAPADVRSVLRRAATTNTGVRNATAVSRLRTAVTTATTPSHAAAAAPSTPTIWAWGTGLRTTTAWRTPSGGRSAL